MTFLAGCVTSCGLLLIAAGAGKLYTSAAKRGGADAIRRALGIRQRTWRVIELALAVTELVVGVIAILGVFPVYDGAAMAVLGATFCTLLGYVRLSRTPGGCGCLGVLGNQHAVSVRTVTRAGLLICAGLAEIITGQNGIDRWSRPFFVLGIVSGSLLLIALSDELDLRTPVCHRPLLRAGAATMKALIQSSVFQAVATAAGPFAVPTHKRNGCTDEYRFTSANDADRVVVFQVSHPKRGGMAVRALLEDTMRPQGNVLSGRNAGRTKDPSTNDRRAASQVQETSNDAQKGLHHEDPPSHCASGGHRTMRADHGMREHVDRGRLTGVGNRSPHADH